MLEVKNLTKYYPGNRIVLRDISFTVGKGEIFGIVGKSGAGKSTLLRCLNLLEVPQLGSVAINGTNIINLVRKDLRKIRKDIGVIFQGFNLLSSKTVFANVALPLKLMGKPKEEIKSRVNELLQLVGLLEFANAYPKNLSGGQKQRVGIARALSTNPKVLLCDEATSSLDYQTTNSILGLLQDINDKFKITIILITHEIEVVRKICDRVMVLDKGMVAEIGNTIDILLHPKVEITRKLVLEEGTEKYLEQVINFYRFHKTETSHLVMVSFIGESTFEPILSKVSLASGVVFSILRGELGLIKRMPFGQLLLEMNGNVSQLNNAFQLLDKVDIHYDVIN